MEEDAATATFTGGVLEAVKEAGEEDEVGGTYQHHGVFTLPIFGGRRPGA